MDYRLLNYADVFIGVLANAPEGESTDAEARSAQLARTIRWQDSNHWLLGPLAHPDHLVSAADDIPMEWLETLYMLEGRYTFEHGELHHTWTVLGSFDRPRPGRARGAHQ